MNKPLLLRAWRRLNNSFDDNEFYKINDKYSYAKLFKTGLSSKEVKRRGIKRYILMARIGLNGIEKKEYFKTKNQGIKALKYLLQQND